MNERSPFLQATRAEDHEQIPVWFMRQAGRSLPEYRAQRGSGSILDAIAQPELATELTLQPVRRYGVDAAILYSDIMVPVHALGFGVDIKPGVGPVVDQPFRERADLNRLRQFEPSVDAPYVGNTVDLLVRELAVPLIGFAGAPFTVASYLIEGKPSRSYALTKSLMYRDEALWLDLMDRLADIAIASLEDQIDHGAQAVQLFDSWAGALSVRQYDRFVLPSFRKIFQHLAPRGVPMIAFGVNTGELLGSFQRAGATVIGVDWRTSLSDARTRLGSAAILQGNLDPGVLLAGWEATRGEAQAVLHDNAGHLGHIFNLGHGVTPEVDPGVLEALVDWLHEQPVRSP